MIDLTDVEVVELRERLDALARAETFRENFGSYTADTGLTERPLWVHDHFWSSTRGTERYDDPIFVGDCISESLSTKVQHQLVIAYDDQLELSVERDLALDLADKFASFYVEQRA